MADYSMATHAVGTQTMGNQHVRAPIPDTEADELDMKRMHKPQELKRVYTVITLAGYAAIIGLAWPFALVEPTAGDRYHWVGAFAPPRLQKPASYIVGWMCALGWQSAVPGFSNVAASIIVGFAIVSNDSYAPQNWHIAILTILICTLAIIVNNFLARKFPAIEITVFAFAKEMFTDFQDNAGWESIGTACFVGVSGSVITSIGSDSAVHLAEELKDASRQLPGAMLASAGFNYVLGFTMLVAFVAVVGNVGDALGTRTGQPWMQVLWNVTHFYLVNAINANTTLLRQLYTFSRDGGLPFSHWISYVSHHRHLPVHAILLSWSIGCGLALIPLGSTAAFVNIPIIGNSGLLSSYIICIACRIHHRNSIGVYGTLSAKPPFNLGVWGGNIINTIAILFLFCFLVSGVFPVAPNPSISSMNWSSFALGSTILIAMVPYIWLRKTYLGAGIGTEVELFEPQMDSKESTYERHIELGKIDAMVVEAAARK